MNPIIIFLTTPRCGTQWLVKNLNKYYKNDAVILHEPIVYEYYPKINLGNYNGPLQPEPNETLEKHLLNIENITQDKIYIEIGWQSIAGVPEFYRRFSKQLKLVHLYRNPINVSASLVTHKWYTKEVKERYEKAELTPFDPGATLTYYQEKWSGLTNFEKCLYYWTEINLRAIEIKNRYSKIPSLDIKFEDIFINGRSKSRITFHKLIPFLSLNFNGKILEELQKPYDNHRHKTTREINIKSLEKHSMTLGLSSYLGYSLQEFTNVKRYKESMIRTLLRGVKNIIRKLVKR